MAGSTTVFYDGRFAETSLMSRRISHFHHAAQLFHPPPQKEAAAVV